MTISSFISKLLLISCFVLLGTSAFALDIPRDCSDLERLQHKWETQYFYDLKFNGYLKNGIPPLKCDSLPYKFVKAIWAIENLKTSPEFGNIYEQLKTHVREFRIMPLIGLPDPITKEMRELRANTTIEIGRIALYLPAFDDATKKDSYPWSNNKYIKNLIRLTSTIIHELRHLQMPEFEHVDCSDKDIQGCDIRFTSDFRTASPYSIQILYLKDLLKNNEFTPPDYELIQSEIDQIQSESFIESVSE